MIDGISASVTTVRRWLSQDALKPWQYQSWIFIRDPQFETKAAAVLDLYARRYNGVELGADEYVISADEKPSIQARRRCHRTQPTGTGRPMRINHDYRRGGAFAYLAAYDVHQAKVFGVRNHDGHRPVHRPGRPGHGAGTVRLGRTGVLDCRQRILTSRTGRDRPAGRQVPERGDGSYPEARLVAESGRDLLSIIQRKVLSPNDFEDLDAIERRLLAFEERYNVTAAPFKWRYTTADLRQHLERLDHHDRNLQAA